MGCMSESLLQVQSKRLRTSMVFHSKDGDRGFDLKNIGPRGGALIFTLGITSAKVIY